MLSEILQGIESGGFLIIQDSCCHSGRDLLKSIINAAINRDEIVHILEFDVSEEELKNGLKASVQQRLHIHNVYADPLGWSDQANFTVQQFNLEGLTHLIKQTSQLKPAILIIDSLSWVLRHVSPPAVCKTLQQLKKGGAVRAIITLLHADMHQNGTVGSICHLATSVVSVTPGMKGDEAVAKITKRAKSGKVLLCEDIFTIKEDFTVTVHSKPSNPRRKQSDSNEKQVDPTANLTFNLRLSETEREAKEKLALPFVFSKEKKTALLHSGPGSGRIVYESDANDDYDLEDPDDDLDV